MPLHLADGVEAVNRLLRARADPHARDRLGNAPLHVVAERRWAAACAALLDAGVAVDVRNHSGLTPLHFAAFQANRAVAELLLARGADINARSEQAYVYKWVYVAWDVMGMEQHIAAGVTPIAYARRAHQRNRWVSSRYEHFADFLAERGANEGWTWRPWK